jgi:hypothetical protein
LRHCSRNQIPSDRPPPKWTSKDLTEALTSACPIVGYDSPHPSDLISVHGGGLLSPLGDCQALGGVLAALATDRPRFVDLIRRAWRDGGRFNSDVISRDCSALIRERLG